MATHSSPGGTTTTIPAYGDIADGPQAFGNFADSLEIFLPPVGTIMPYTGTPPANSPWLLCDGSPIPTDAKYAKIRALVGNNLPNLRGKFLVGVDAGDTDFGTLLKAGGSKNLTVQGTITKNNLPQHTHTATVTVSTENATHSHGEDAATQDNTASAHTHGAGFRETNDFVRGGSDKGAVPTGTVSAMDRTASAGMNAFTHNHAIHAANATHSHTVTVTNAADGGVAVPTPLSLTGAVTPPHYTVNYLIRAF